MIMKKLEGVDEKMKEEYGVEDSCKILKALSKILSESGNAPSEAEVLDYKEDFMLLDPANVMGIIPKTRRAKLLCRKFLDKDNQWGKVPELKYDSPVRSKSRFSTDFMVYAVNLFKAINTLKGVDADESAFWMSVGSDYPVTMSNEDWVVVLAPRIEE